MTSFHWLTLVILCTLRQSVIALSEPGQRTFRVDEKNGTAFFVKSLYNNSRVAVRISCNSKSVNVTVNWVLRHTPCAEEYANLVSHYERLKKYFDNPDFQQIREFSYVAQVKKSSEDEVDHRCDESVLLEENNAPINDKSSVTTASSGTTSGPRKSSSSTKSVGGQRRRRFSNSSLPFVPVTGQVTSVWNDGIYLFVIQLTCSPSNPRCLFTADVTVEMRADYGWLSAIEWPLLPFYGTMCLIYLFFGFLWLIFCARHWRELLRIQFCIAGVIFLGMLENAVFYLEYQSINSSGASMRGAIVMAELVSCLKRTFARVLVIVVALGYGIVKPRLGNDDRKVLAVAVFHFIFGGIESSFRSLRPRFEQSKDELYASIPLAFIDAIICWWIFSSLVQTTKGLRLRRNIVKLSLYRHFTNTLVFAILASLAFIVWSVVQHKYAICITAWKELWIDTAFWHLLFAVLLLVIMVLWRPSKNNQRYAFSPLLDEDENENEEDDVLMDNVASGIKSRSVGSTPEDRLASEDAKDKRHGEDDLRWVEENIPTTIVDSALPSLLDSEEEILTTRYHMSKMD